METNDSVLIIGKPKSGKTTFLAQFYRRVQKNKSKIKLSAAPKNIKAIEDAMKRLAKGEEPQSTPAESNEVLVLPVKIDDKEFELVCPDYGGEQVRQMIELMEFDENWKSRVIACDKWMLFIRPSTIINYYDLSNSKYEELETKRSEGHLSSSLSEQCQLIELLQMLLFLKEKGVKQSITSPSLTIVFTCWDEISTTSKPDQYMQEVLPLMYDFIRTNWKKNAYRILGLSAQEFALNTEEAKNKYLEELPETFGYLVGDEVPDPKDITLLIDIAFNDNGTPSDIR